MRFDRTVLLNAILALSARFSVRTISAQAASPVVFGTEPGQIPILETSLGSSFVHTNAPRGQCGCFSASRLQIAHGFGIVAESSPAY